MVTWDAETKESSENNGLASLIYKQAMSKQQKRDPVPNKWEDKGQNCKLSSGLNTCTQTHIHLHTHHTNSCHTHVYTYAEIN